MAQLKILIFIVGAHYGAYWLLSRLTPFRNELKIYVIAATAIIFVACILKMLALAYVITAYLCYHFTKGKTDSQKICFLLGIVFIMPNDAGFILNPGVYLGIVSYYKILVLCVFLPILIKGRKERAFSKFNIIDIATIFFFVWQLMVNFKLGSIMGALRENMWLFTDILIPYLALRWFLKKEDYLLAFTSISFALLAQMFISIAEGITSWRLYDSFREVAGYQDFIYNMYKYRHGFLRTEAVFGNPLVLSLFCNFSALATYILLRKQGFKLPEGYKNYWAFGAFMVACAGTFFTGSRAGMFGVIIILVLYYLFDKGIKARRDPKPKAVMLIILGVVGIMIFGVPFLKENFGYRYLLVETSIPVIMDNFFTGSFDVLNDPRMQVLRQGEGIIDLVNSYIFFALYFGVPATIALLTAFISGILKTFAALREGSSEIYTMGIFMLCSLSILTFNLATTSPLLWSYHWIWVILAISSNLVARVEADKRASNKSLLDG